MQDSGDKYKDTGSADMDRNNSINSFPVGSTQAENVSTHGMSGVLNESKHESAYEGDCHVCVCVCVWSPNLTHSHQSSTWRQ